MRRSISARFAGGLVAAQAEAGGPQLHPGQQGPTSLEDLDLALAVTAGATLALGSLLHAQPDRDDAKSSDLVVRGLLRQFAIPADEAARISSLGLPDLDVVDTPGS